MKYKVYLSGRMSGVDEKIWRERFNSAEIDVRKCGFDVVNPANTLIARHKWLFWLIGYRLTLWFDLQLLRRCDYIRMVDDEWQHSRGARLERMKAAKWNIPIVG